MKKLISKITSISLAIIISAQLIPMAIAKEYEAVDVKGTNPIPVFEKLFENTENISFPVEEQKFDLKNSKSMSELINGISSRNTEAIDLLQSYYVNNYGDINNVDIIFKGYFTEYELQSNNFSRPYRALEDMKLMFVCFMKNSDIPKVLKQNIIDLINSGYTIQEALNLYLTYSKNSDLQKNNKSYSFNASDNVLSEFAQENQIMPMALGSDPIKEDIWKNNILENKYYTPSDDGISIDEKFGTLICTRNDVSIPLKNGMKLEFPIQYNSSEAEAVLSGREYTSIYSWQGPMDYDIVNKYDHLGIGWSYCLTKIHNGLITLADGRTIEINLSTKKAKYFNFHDISVEYDSLNNLWRIIYLDGTTELIPNPQYLSDLSYVKQKVDKYGNYIMYNYDENDSTKLTKIYYGNDESISVNIEYFNNQTVITLPDNNKIYYIKSKKNISYGSNFTDGSRNIDIYVLSEVKEQNGFGSSAYYEYEAIEYSYMIEVSTGHLSTGQTIYCDEYKTYLLMTEFSNCVTNNKRNYTYERSPEYFYIYTPMVKTINYNNRNIKTYTRIFYWMYYKQTKETLTTTINADGLVIKTQYDTVTNSNKITSTYIRKNNIDTLKISETIEYNNSKTYLPLYTEQKIYNNEGNYINTRHEYEYNNKDKIISLKEIIDGIEKSHIINTYNNDNYCSLTKTTLYDGNNNNICETEYEINSFGDITKELVFDCMDNERKCERTII